MNRITLTVSRTIPASPAEVFDVWLDPKSPGGPWFGSERVIMNLSVDGLFYQALRHEGRTFAHYGRFVRLDKPSLIEHTWMSEATHGFESTVRVSLEAKGDSTLVTVVHSDLPEDDMGRGHEEGWKFVLGSIESRFARRTSR